MKTKIGDNVFIRGVAYHYTGKIKSIDDGMIELEDAAWIADSGRLTDALTSGAVAEVEIFPEGVSILKESVFDICPWPHPLPREQK